MCAKMEDVHHSSAYSSLANSTTEINEKTSIECGKKNVDQIRDITEDYNSLLKRATKEIKSLASEKFELETQSEKLMSVNEVLVGDLAKAIRRETELKKENEAIIQANKELFEEAQRLSDEEEKWMAEKVRLQEEMADLKDKINAIEQNVSFHVEKESETQEVVKRLEDRNHVLEKQLQAEKGELASANQKLEAKVMSLKSRIQSLESENDGLIRKKEKMSGENLQLMVDVDDQAKQFHQKTASLQNQLQKAQDRCRDLEKENVRLKSAPPVIQERTTKADADLAKKYESLVEKNKNLTEWREQLISKNKSLSEENDKLKKKCQNLEDLLNEEETDINDVLELIKKMQCGSPGAASQVAAKIGPISKFRADLQFK